MNTRAAVEGERKRVTVLFVDVQDSVGVSRGVDPEDWHRILSGFFEIISRTVHAFEGTINQYTGDGVMALFGAPVAHEDHARRACHAALRIRDELQPYAEKLKKQNGLDLGFRIGLNTGDVVVGKIGDDLRMDYTAHGYVVGIAARMEEMAAPGAVYLAENTASLVEGLCDLRPLGAVEINGVQEPVQVYELVSAHPERTSLAVRRSRGLSRFVGREPELNFLKAALERARRGHGQAVAIVGGPGVGKSRLCLEFERYCMEQGSAVYKVHGVPHGRLLSFFPALSLIRAYLGVGSEDSAAVARDRIRDRLLALGEESEDRLPRVYEYLGVQDPAVIPANIHPKLRQSRDLAFIRWALLKAQREKTIVLILEDLQWFDDSSLEIVDMLVRAVPHSQVMIVGTLRPEYRPDFVYDGQCHRLALGPLEARDSVSLTQDLLGAAPGLADLAGRIAESAAGNPFFIEEIVEDLRGNGALEGRRGELRLTGGTQTIKVPTSIQDVLAARVDRLPEKDKRVLQAAAVIGREFPLAILKSMVDVPPLELAASLEKLRRADFISESGGPFVYQFKHALTQEAVYRSLLRDRRARLHALVAETITRTSAQKLDENSALLGHHWEGAGEIMQAVFAYHRAAEWVVRKDVRQSLIYRHKVMALQEGQLLNTEARRVYIATRRNLLHWAPISASLSPKEAEILFEEGCAASNHETLLDMGLLYGAYAIYQALCTSFAKGVEYSELCSKVLGDAGQPWLQIYAETLVKPICYSSMGRPREGHAICENALRILKQKGVPPVIDGANPYVWASTFHAMSTANLGDLQGAMKLLRDGTVFAREHSDIMVVNLLGSQARFSYFIGVTGDADECSREALELAVQTGAEHWLAQAHYYRGMAHVIHERWREAREHFESSRAHSRHGDVIFAVYGVSTAWLAYALVQMGEADAAPALIEAALKLAEERESFWVLQEALMLRCAILRESRGAAAEVEIRTTLARWDASIDENGAEMYRHLVWLERARLAEWGDYPPAVTGALTQALAVAKKIGAEGYVARIERELKGKK